MNFDVLIPVATESKYVREAIISATQQRADKKIFILENNIGNKEYSLYLKNLAEEFAVEYIFFENRLPIFLNWQRCLSIGKSEWVAFLHDDDIWPSDYLKIINKLQSTSDIIFFEYEYFVTKNEISVDLTEYSVSKISCREELLAVILDSYSHASSVAFKRSLNLNFPKNFKMLGDQYAFRGCIASNIDIHASWVHSNNKTLIRNHPNQITWQGALLFAAKENSLLYKSFMKSIGSQKIDVNKFSSKLLEKYDDVILIRIMSSILFEYPYGMTTKIIFNIIYAKKSPILLFRTIIRFLFQNLVWSVKQMRKKYDI